MGSIWRIDNNCGHNVARYQVWRKRSYSGFRQYNLTKPAKYRLYVRWWLWVLFAVLPTLVWWWWWGWCPDKEQSGAQHSAGAGQTKTQLGLWRPAAAAWRPDAGCSPHHTAPTTATPAWSPGSGFSFHTPPFVSLPDFYCTVSFGNLELQMQNCTKWEVKQAIIKSLYCVNCDWYGNETLTEVYILYCLCLCHILYLTKVHSYSSWGAMLASL